MKSMLTFQMTVMAARVLLYLVAVVLPLLALRRILAAVQGLPGHGCPFNLHYWRGGCR